MTAPRSSLAIAGLAVFTVWITWQAKTLEGGFPSPLGTALIGKTPPAFTLKTTGGQSVSLADYAHKKNVALVFWASWCGPCRMELPLLKQFYEKARPMRNDFEILAISVDDYADAASGAANGMHLPFPVLVDGVRVASDYGVGGIPQLLVVDKSGKVTFGHAGADMGVDVMLAQQFGLDLKQFLNTAPGKGPDAGRN